MGSVMAPWAPAPAPRDGTEGLAQLSWFVPGRNGQGLGVGDLGTLQAQEGPIVPTLGGRDRSRACLETSQTLLKQLRQLFILVQKRIQ